MIIHKQRVEDYNYICTRAGIICSWKMVIILALAAVLGHGTVDNIAPTSSYVLAATFEDKLKEHDMLFKEVERLEKEIDTVKRRLAALEQPPK